MSGWISIYRKIQEHWIWQDEKYLKWWLTIILNVNHEPKKFPVGNEVLVCNPGQSFRSIEQWTAMFLCSKKTTVKFFEMLKNDDMIQCEIVGKGNRRKHLLTVVNWDEYQKKETEISPPRKPECSVNGNPNVTPNNKDNNENKNNKTSSSLKAKNNSKIIDLDYSVIDPEYLNIVTDWLDYKTARKETYKSQQALLSFIKKLKEISNVSPGVARMIIEQSMANNWAGIFELKSNKNGNKTNSRASREPATADQLAKDTGW